MKNNIQIADVRFLIWVEKTTRVGVCEKYLILIQFLHIFFWSDSSFLLFSIKPLFWIFPFWNMICICTSKHTYYMRKTIWNFQLQTCYLEFIFSIIIMDFPHFSHIIRPLMAGKLHGNKNLKKLSYQKKHFIFRFLKIFYFRTKQATTQFFNAPKILKIEFVDQKLSKNENRPGSRKWILKKLEIFIM